MRRTLLICAFIASFAVVASTAVTAAPVTPIYNNIPSPLPGNLPSWGFEATGTQEFGDRVGFTTTARRLVSVTQTMSSWGCQIGHWYSADCVTTPGATFTHSVTMNLYNVAGTAPGTLIGTKTQTFVMPYRPSTDPINCTGGRWFDGTTCFNGKAFTITFDFSSQNLTLPNQVIFGVAYNTTHHGYTPMGETTACFMAPPPSGGCPYDSLNVALADPATTLSAGTQPAPNDAYQDTDYSSCSNGAIHPFGLDAGCWNGFKPATEFIALQCHKGDGDGDFGDKDGHKHHAKFHQDSCGNGGGEVADDDDSGKHFQSTSTDSATYNSSADSETMTLIGTGLDDGVPVGFTMVAIDYHGLAPAIYTLTLTNGRTFTGSLLSGTVLLQ
jgi:hypothetical protein